MPKKPSYQTKVRETAEEREAELNKLDEEEQQQIRDKRELYNVPDSVDDEDIDDYIEKKQKELALERDFDNLPIEEKIALRKLQVLEEMRAKLASHRAIDDYIDQYPFFEGILEQYISSLIFLSKNCDTLIIAWKNDIANSKLTPDFKFYKMGKEIQPAEMIDAVSKEDEKQ
jgi:5,10-methylene-tetrahydrofolate dehydrogenase/methenyl tetrahydrofolate cyclohydrolase